MDHDVAIALACFRVCAAGVKQYDAPWLKNAKQVFRNKTGQFSSKSADNSENDLDEFASEAIAGLNKHAEDLGSALENIKDDAIHESLIRTMRKGDAGAILDRLEAKTFLGADKVIRTAREQWDNREYQAALTGMSAALRELELKRELESSGVADAVRDYRKAQIQISGAVMTLMSIPNALIASEMVAGGVTATASAIELGVLAGQAAAASMGAPAAVGAIAGLGAGAALAVPMAGVFAFAAGIFLINSGRVIAVGSAIASNPDKPFRAMKKATDDYLSATAEAVPAAKPVIKNFQEGSNRAFKLASTVVEKAKSKQPNPKLEKAIKKVKQTAKNIALASPMADEALDEI